MTLTQSELKSLLTYNPQTGIFIWNISRGKQKKGNIAGSLNGKGYLRIIINSKEYLSHRLVFLYMNGKMPTEEVDHINRNKIDNRYLNLRLVSHKENHLNKGVFRNNKVGLSGIEFNKAKNQWRVRIQKDKKRYFLGYFDDLEVAKEARRKAQNELGFHSNCNKELEAI